MSTVQKSVTDEDEIDTVLAPDIDFSGTIETGKSLLIKGKISGTIVCGDDLYLSESARVDAVIRARRVIIRGTLRGRVTAIESIQVIAGSEVDAELDAPEVIVEDREHFRGVILGKGLAEDV